MTDEAPSNLRELAALASERNEGKRARELERLAAQAGHVLSRTTASNILNGSYSSKPSRATIEALAYLAKVPRKVAYKAAGVTFPHSPLAEQLPEGADSLTADQQRVIVELARVFVNQNTYIHELESTDDRHVTQEQEPGPEAPDAQHESADRPEDGSTPQRTGAPMSEPAEDELARRRKPWKDNLPPQLSPEEFAELDRRQREAEAIPMEEIAKWAAYQDPDSESRKINEAYKTLGEETQLPAEDEQD